jgi:hypothetical protein
MHNYFVRDFIQSAGFGVRRMAPMTPAPSYPLQIGEEHYIVDKRELVGLLRGEEPVIYVDPTRTDRALDRPIPLDARGHASTHDNDDRIVRPLASFERRALARLHDGRDIVAEFGTGPPRIMGALRATSECVRCHGGNEGDLLGALVYFPRSVAAEPEAKSRSGNEPLSGAARE